MANQAMEEFLDMIDAGDGFQEDTEHTASGSEMNPSYSSSNEDNGCSLSATQHQLNQNDQGTYSVPMNYHNMLVDLSDRFGKQYFSMPEIKPGTGANVAWGFIVPQAIESYMNFENCFFNSQRTSRENNRKTEYEIQLIDENKQVIQKNQLLNENNRLHNYIDWIRFRVICSDGELEIVWGNVMWTIMVDYLSSDQKKAFNLNVEWDINYEDTSRYIIFAVKIAKKKELLQKYTDLITKEVITIKKVFLDTQPHDKIHISNIRCEPDDPKKRVAKKRKLDDLTTNTAATMEKDNNLASQGNHIPEWVVDVENCSERKIFRDVLVTDTITAMNYRALSDQRLKENIENISLSDINNIMNINIVKYNLKNSDPNTPKSYGVIAQQVQTTHSGLVKQDKNGLSSVDHYQLAALALALGQQNQKDIQEHKKERSSMSQEICTLQKDIQHIIHPGSNAKRMVISAFRSIITMKSSWGKETQQYLLDIISLYPCFMGGYDEQPVDIIMNHIHSVFERWPNQTTGVKATICLAQLYFYQKGYSASVHYYTQCNEVLSKNQCEIEMLETYKSMVCFGVAKNYERQNRISEAEKKFKECLQMDARMARGAKDGNIQHLINVWTCIISLANIYIDTKKYKEAADLLPEGLRIAEKLSEETKDKAKDYLYYTETTLVKFYLSQSLLDDNLPAQAKLEHLEKAKSIHQRYLTHFNSIHERIFYPKAKEDTVRNLLTVAIEIIDLCFQLGIIDYAIVNLKFCIIFAESMTPLQCHQLFKYIHTRIWQSWCNLSSLCQFLEDLGMLYNTKIGENHKPFFYGIFVIKKLAFSHKEDEIELTDNYQLLLEDSFTALVKMTEYIYGHTSLHGRTVNNCDCTESDKPGEPAQSKSINNFQTNVKSGVQIVSDGIEDEQTNTPGSYSISDDELTSQHALVDQYLSSRLDNDEEKANQEDNDNDA